MKIFLHTLICIISINMADAQWTTANLSTTRFSLSATSVGTKVFFAGGFHNNVTPSSVVNIYDNSTSLWTIANLSVARGYLSAATVGSKVFFAGGDDGNPSSVVDIYKNHPETLILFVIFHSLKRSTIKFINPLFMRAQPQLTFAVFIN